MLYLDGDLIWVPPIRYYDHPMPLMRPCRLVGDQRGEARGIGSHSLYVHMEEETDPKQNTYVSLPVFYNSATAYAYCIHMKAIHDLIAHDEASAIVDRMVTDNQTGCVLQCVGHIKTD